MRDIIFLRQPINSATRQVLWRNKFNLLPKHPNRHDNYFFVWKRSLFGQIDFTKSKVKTWRFYARLFFFLYRKVIIIILKYKLSTLEGILFFFWYKKTSRSVGNRVFDQIKRERKEKVATSKKKETLTFFSTAKIIFSSFFFFSFSWLKGYRSL